MDFGAEHIMVLFLLLFCHFIAYSQEKRKLYTFNQLTEIHGSLSKQVSKYKYVSIYIFTHTPHNTTIRNIVFNFLIFSGNSIQNTLLHFCNP